jgi:hypothetical protein
MPVITELQYFAPVSAFKILKEQTDVVIEQYEMFQKASFRNRCIIFGANGLISLTIPVAGGREQKVPIREVEIDYSTPWQKAHIRSLESAYNKSPFYHFYKEEIDGLLLSKEKYLFDLNFKILEYLCKRLIIRCVITFTSTFNLDFPDALDIRNSILPKNFQQNAENWKPKYAQVFEEKAGFQPNLSILDLLFCEGPNATNLI